MKVLDELRADHPDPAVEARLLLAVAGAQGRPGGEVGAALRVETPPDAGLDLERIEAWDGAIAAALGRGATALAFAVGDETRLVTVFHAAITWLGLRDGRLRTVRLDVEGERPDLAAAFARESERHLELAALALPRVEWLAPEHQWEALAPAAWAYASGPGRPAGLSARQLFAIRLYTTELYAAFHRGLRAGRGDDPVYRTLLPLIACLDAGLENLPAVAATTFRGERSDAASAPARRTLEPGDRFAEPSYMSSSRGERYAAALRKGFLFRIRGRSGRDVSAFSEYPWESEVLFGRGMVQRVLAKDCSRTSVAEECDYDTEEARPDRFLAARGTP